RLISLRARTPDWNCLKSRPRRRLPWKRPLAELRRLPSSLLRLAATDEQSPAEYVRSGHTLAEFIEPEGRGHRTALHPAIHTRATATLRVRTADGRFVHRCVLLGKRHPRALAVVGTELHVS